MAAPDATPDSLRRRVETASRPALKRMTSWPRLTIPIVTVVLVGIGMLAPLPVALPALAAVVLFLAWIAYLAWPVVDATGKVLRLLMIALVLALGVVHVIG